MPEWRPQTDHGRRNPAPCHAEARNLRSRAFLAMKLVSLDSRGITTSTNLCLNSVQPSAYIFLDEKSLFPARLASRSRVQHVDRFFYDSPKISETPLCVCARSHPQERRSRRTALANSPLAGNAPKGRGESCNCSAFSLPIVSAWTLFGCQLRKPWPAPRSDGTRRRQALCNASHPPGTAL